MLAIAICLVGKYFIWQVALMTAQIITQLIIIGSGVFSTARKRKTEYFNELIILMVMYTIFCYTPWFYDIESRPYIGYVTIVIVLMHLIVNFYIIIGGSILDIKIKCRFRMIKRRLN